MVWTLLPLDFGYKNSSAVAQISSKSCSSSAVGIGLEINSQAPLYWGADTQLPYL